MFQYKPVQNDTYRYIRSSGLGAGGREFESPHPDQIYQDLGDPARRLRRSMPAVGVV
jgi:hypothetical protein